MVEGAESASFWGRVAAASNPSGARSPPMCGTCMGGLRGQQQLWCQQRKWVKALFVACFLAAAII